MVPEYLVETKIVPNPEYKKEQKPMRNNIQVIDRVLPKISVANLEVGALFRYPKNGNPSNVYMKIKSPLGDGAVVLLATGVLYSDFNIGAEVETIDACTISR